MTIVLTAERALVLTASALARVNHSESAGIYVSAQNHVFFFFFFFEAKGFVCFWYICLLSTFCMHMLSWLLLDLTLDLRSDFPSCLFKGWLGVYPMVLLFLLPVDNLFSWPLTVIDQVACLFTILFIPNSTQGSFSQTCLE